MENSNSEAEELTTTDSTTTTAAAKEYLVYLKTNDGKYVTKGSTYYNLREEPTLVKIIYAGGDISIMVSCSEHFETCIHVPYVKLVQIVDGELFVMHRGEHPEYCMYTLGFFYLDAACDEGVIQYGTRSDEHTYGIKPEQRLYIEFPTLKPTLK